MTTFPSSSLYSALQSVIAPTKKPQSGLHSYVRLATGDHSLATIAAQNDRLYCSNEITGVVGDNLDALIHADLLQCSITTASPETSIEILDGRAKVTSGSRKSIIPVMPMTLENWQSRDVAPQCDRIICDSKLLLVPLSSASNTANRCLIEDFRFVELTVGGGNLNVASTNRRSLSVFKIGSVSSTRDGRVAIPDATCEEVVRHLGHHDGDITISLRDKAIGFLIGGLYIESQQIETTRNILESYHKVTASQEGQLVTAKLNRVEFLLALKSIKSMSTNKETSAIVDICGGIEVRSRSSDAESETRIECETSGTCVLHVSCDDLLPLLGKVEDEFIELSHWTGNNFILFSVANGSLMSCLMR